MILERKKNSIWKLREAGKNIVLSLDKLLGVEQRENLDEEESDERVDKTHWANHSIERNVKSIERTTTRPFF